MVLHSPNQVTPPHSHFVSICAVTCCAQRLLLKTQQVDPVRFAMLIRRRITPKGQNQDKYVSVSDGNVQGLNSTKNYSKAHAKLFLQRILYT